MAAALEKTLQKTSGKGKCRRCFKQQATQRLRIEVRDIGERGTQGNKTSTNRSQQLCDGCLNRQLKRVVKAFES